MIDFKKLTQRGNPTCIIECPKCHRNGFRKYGYGFVHKVKAEVSDSGEPMLRPIEWCVRNESD